MFRNYLKIAWRSLWKNKLQTGINLFGLSVGTVCCLSILLYVFSQFGYDEYHEDSASIYRLRTDLKSIGNSSIDVHFATSGPPYAFAVRNEFPEVEEAARVVYLGEDSGELLRTSENQEGYFEPNGYLADSTVFNVLSFNFIEGLANNSLEEPNTIVLSSSLAEKLYGKQSALNKTIIRGTGEDKISLKVTGVFDDSFGKSHLNPNYIITMNTPGMGEFVRNNNNFATQNFIYTYLKLAPGTKASQLEQKFPAFLEKYASKDLEKQGRKKQLFLQPIADINLYSEGIDMQIGNTSSISYLRLLLILAFFIQAVACINFINLSTARANRRAKEIGIRKTIGAGKKMLVSQFMGESLILSLVACIISLPVTALILPLVNELTQASLQLNMLLDLKVLISLMALGILTGLIAGVYPALVLSSVKPISVLKSSMNSTSGNSVLRKALVVFQFIISISLIAAVLIITEQLRYSQNKDIGFNKENLIALRLGSAETRNNIEALRNELENISGVTATAATNSYPSEPRAADVGMHLPSQSSNNITAVIYNGVSPNYFETIGTKLLAGRKLSEKDSTQIIVNEAFLESFGIDLKDAVGHKMILESGGTQELEIAGVTQNYHFASLKEKVRPVMSYLDTRTSWVMVRTKTSDYQKLLGNIEDQWKKLNKSTPLDYKFIDKEAAKLFAVEQRLAKISTTFTVLAIFLSALGLFGLISFIAEQRKKEIGIRKVLGASIGNVLSLLTRDLIGLVILALVISTPVAYYFLNDWLEDFQYRITIHWWVFLLAGIIAMTITLFTVGFQALKAAVANPIKSLRTE